MNKILFFKKKKYKASDIFTKSKINKDFIIDNVKSLQQAGPKDISFLDHIRYKEDAGNTKAGICITTDRLVNLLPNKTQKIIVKSVLFEMAKLLKKIYPDSDIDYPDLSVKKPSKKKYRSVKFGNNVLVGKNVKIGINSKVGSNTIIEQNVVIGNDCVIGSGVIIKNSILGNRVIIQDDCKIGQKGFGFIPLKSKNFKFPHVGKVLIMDDVEISSGCTIDRGSIDDTIIGNNTYLDNQVHVAHNVKIGSNCMIAGQVGIAGSSKIGNQVSIGGQAGISGHLSIGNNVKIGGGSGVVKNVDNNEVVMGYPAVPLKEFLKKNERDRNR
tara:strand:- start:290 stop:1267 length:978 start_codon:yes stop_codon:yes gene_type:complete